jgi:hypothetical protein
LEKRGKLLIRIWDQAPLDVHPKNCNIFNEKLIKQSENFEKASKHPTRLFIVKYLQVFHQQNPKTVEKH